MVQLGNSHFWTVEWERHYADSESPTQAVRLQMEAFVLHTLQGRGHFSLYARYGLW